VPANSCGNDEQQNPDIYLIDSEECRIQNSRPQNNKGCNFRGYGQSPALSVIAKIFPEKSIMMEPVIEPGGASGITIRSKEEKNSGRQKREKHAEDADCHEYSSGY